MSPNRDVGLEAQLNITTGSMFGSAVSFSVPLHEEGVQFDVVFRAANAVESLEEDLAHLPQGWPQRVRTALDEVGAPSMSVGDWFTISVGDRELGGKQVTASGWVDVAPGESPEPVAATKESWHALLALHGVDLKEAADLAQPEGFKSPQSKTVDVDRGVQR
jgi:hypothetical protein